MRQAGRYLPEYRAVREKSDFLTMCQTPELATEVTLQPIDIIGTDAAIIFSDILVIPEAMGMKLQMIESVGPVFDNPVRTRSDMEKLKVIDPTKELKYVLDAVSLTKKELDGRVPLIGFSGSPWTLLVYMVEGKGSKSFSKIKKLIYSDPSLAHALLVKISDAVAAYLSAKIEAGADAVQIFDTWGGILGPREFSEFSLQYVTRVIEQVKRTQEPLIFFGKGVHYAVDDIAACGADVMGLDWTMDLGKVREQTGGKVALQGNLDPTVLYGEPDFIRQRVGETLESYGKGTGHIFNLGHGILPDIQPAHAKALVDAVKELSPAYH